MKENPYDNDGLFEKYSQMPRSVEGLPAAGEWQTLQKLLPELRGKRVLDLGCGYGWHCAYAAWNGASEIVGVDISKKMLEVARRKTGTDRIHYLCCAMEDLLASDCSFDVVLSSLAFHYIKDFPRLVARIYRWLTPGGSFVFSVEHPLFTAYGPQEWYRNEQGEILHFPVDKYFYEGTRAANFLGETVTKYHRTLTTYVDTLLTCGFRLRHLVEPMPPENMLDQPGMRDELRRPMMLIIAADKPS